MERESLRRRNLPHWDVPHAAYFVTTCLQGSIPAEGRLDIDRHRDQLNARVRPPGISEQQWVERLWKLGFSRTDEWLDTKPAVRHLADPRLARIVVDALFHFAGLRYDLLAYVVMPSHLHWVFQPIESWFESRPEPKRTPREQIVHSINSFTASECNKVLETSGRFWQHECYDHWVRDDGEMRRIIEYVEGDPVKAGHVEVPEDWEFSSSSWRHRHRLELGVALTSSDAE